jgi:hypothetical protein
MRNSLKTQRYLMQVGYLFIGAVLLLLVLMSVNVRGVSASEWTEDRLSDGVAGQLGDELEKTLPDSVYGGIWIADDGVVQVGIVEGKDVSSSSKGVVRKKAISYGLDKIDIRPVGNSWRTLLDANEAINRLHQQNVDYKKGAWPIQMGIKTDRNKVQVDIPADKSKLTTGHHTVLDAIAKQYKDQVFFETYDNMPTEEACSTMYCDSPLRGGVGIKGSSSSISPYCTAGFILRGKVSGSLYVLTAGHCRTGGLNWSTKLSNGTGKSIGAITHDLYDWGDNADAMTVLINPSHGWGVQGKIFARSGSNGLNGVSPPSQNELFGITGYNSSVVGERVCFSPAVTGGASSNPKGGSCGKVHQIVINWTAGGKTTLVNRAGYCSRGGDSGGPVYSSNNRARGIHRGTGDAPICSDNKYFTAMLHIFNTYSNRNLHYELY